MKLPVSGRLSLLNVCLNLYEMNSPRVLVIGSGLAAGMFAAQIPASWEIWQFAAGGPSGSSSYKAKGGIAIPLDENDFEAHVKDTLVAGSFHNKESVVKELLEASLPALAYWKSRGFNPDFHKALEGGHSVPRVVHIGDETGKHITQVVYDQLEKQTNLKRFEGYRLLDLIQENKQVKGVELLHESSRKVYRIYGHAVVFATGGGSALFGFHSNAPHSTGEALAIANRAGAQVDDLEFVQFHPTLFMGKDPQKGQLITEALRGAGAELLSQDFHPFMRSRHPLGSLAPRDLVSQGVFYTMQQSGSNFVWLDISQISELKMKSHFPALYSWFRKDGFLALGKVPVAPGAHYFCGGIAASTSGETNLDGLYALGEVACTGLHGANRLASNSLMEILASTWLLAKKWQAEHHSIPSLPKNQLIGYQQRNENYSRTAKKIGEMLTQYAGIVRTQAGLNKVAAELNYMEEESDFLNNEVVTFTPLDNKIQTAKLLVEAASRRTQSLGCHFLEDEPNPLNVLSEAELENELN